MVETQSSEIVKEILDASKVSLSLVPRNLAGQIVPTIEINPRIVKLAKVAHATSTATTAAIMNANPDNDVYIIGGQISVIKNATATSTNTFMSFTDENGAVVRPVQIMGLSLTAQDRSESFIFTHPVKIKRNTPINLNNGTNVASILAGGSVHYYIDECSNA